MDGAPEYEEVTLDPSDSPLGDLGPPEDYDVLLSCRFPTAEIPRPSPVSEDLGPYSSMLAELSGLRGR